MFNLTAKRKTCLIKAFFLLKKTSLDNTLNNVSMDKYPVLNEIITQYLEKYTVIIKSRGGGFTSISEAAKLALLKYIVKQNIEKKETIKLKYPNGLKSDPRKKWPKLPEGRGARAKRQKSYR